MVGASSSQWWNRFLNWEMNCYVTCAKLCQPFHWTASVTWRGEADVRWRLWSSIDKLARTSASEMNFPVYDRMGFLLHDVQNISQQYYFIKKSILIRRYKPNKEYIRTLELKSFRRDVESIVLYFERISWLFCIDVLECAGWRRNIHCGETFWTSSIMPFLCKIVRCSPSK